MASLKVKGGTKLRGTLKPSGNKNSVLPILCATLLTDEVVVLENVPSITDVNKLLSFFLLLGSVVEFDEKENRVRLHHKEIRPFRPDEVPSEMRSSILLFSPLIYRLGTVQFHMNTKGCALGVREIDPHLHVLNAFGYGVDVSLELLTLRRKGQPKATDHWFDYASVTATENFMMAAVVTEGKSTLSNAASEPHVQDLSRFLEKMGARISGIGSNTLRIEGVDKLHGCTFSIPDDHHEVATYLAIGGITHGQISIDTAIQHHLPLILGSFEKMGVPIRKKGTLVSVDGDHAFTIKKPLTENTFQKIEAAPWPYFPADLLPPFIALATACNGNMLFWNKVYEGGLSWIPELNKFGAFAHLSDPHKVIVIGNAPLHPTTVESPYIIRAAIALLMVGLSVPGVTTIHKADPIKRAHPKFIDNLQSLGADVEWVN